MITKHLAALSVTAAFTAMFAATTAGQTAKTVAARPPKTAFLTRIPSRFVIPPGDPRQPAYCRQLQVPLRCPPLVVFGGNGRGALPTIDPAFKAYLPNVRVSIVIYDIFNEEISGGGVGPESDPHVSFTTTGSAADVQAGGPYSFELPGPGEGSPLDDPLPIYDAIVYNACESLAAFPIDHTALSQVGPGEVEAFHGVDNSTVDSTGFYNISYTYQATDMIGATSTIHVSGKVSVTCSAANSL